MGHRSHHQAEVAPKRRQAFIAGHSLPGTAIFTLARSSGLFVMLKRLICGVGTEQGGGKGAHGVGAEISPLWILPILQVPRSYLSRDRPRAPGQVLLPPSPGSAEPQDPVSADVLCKTSVHCIGTGDKSGAELLPTVLAKPTPRPEVMRRALTPLLCGLCHIDNPPRPTHTPTDLAALPTLLVQMSVMGEGGK